jgi:peroxiredoxin/glutaredoxin
MDLCNRRVPDIAWHMRRDGELRHVTSAELFAGKRVVAFGLPGAFTPTCSGAHLPRYVDLAPVFRANGVDEILCIAVNDPFVMEAWQREQRAAAITFVPDGNAEFTRRLGLLVDQSAKGLGERSRRYAMVVRDGVIEHAFVEPEAGDDPYSISDADNVLKAIAPDARVPPDIVLFTRTGCRFCMRAERLLRERGLPHEPIVASLRVLRAVSGRQSTPQVFVDGRYIGGCDELERWLGTAQGGLHPARQATLPAPVSQDRGAQVPA